MVQRNGGRRKKRREVGWVGRWAMDEAGIRKENYDVEGDRCLVEW